MKLSASALAARRARRADRLASQARMTAAQAATRAIVAQGACPTCGRPLRQNYAITGWWQCSQFGDGHFRADPSQPSCDWQGFTS